ncbi:hypothetical protein PFISCL1PPCAC_21092, partial [Pristionchus fissidentatus]
GVGSSTGVESSPSFGGVAGSGVGSGTDVVELPGFGVDVRTGVRSASGLIGTGVGSVDICTSGRRVIVAWIVVILFLLCFFVLFLRSLCGFCGDRCRSAGTVRSLAVGEPTTVPWPWCGLRREPVPVENHGGSGSSDKLPHV